MNPTETIRERIKTRREAVAAYNGELDGGTPPGDAEVALVRNTRAEVLEVLELVDDDALEGHAADVVKALRQGVTRARPGFDVFNQADQLELLLDAAGGRQATATPPRKRTRRPADDAPTGPEGDDA